MSIIFCKLIDKSSKFSTFYSIYNKNFTLSNRMIKLPSCTIYYILSLHKILYTLSHNFIIQYFYFFYKLFQFFYFSNSNSNYHYINKILFTILPSYFPIIKMFFLFPNYLISLMTFSSN